LPGPSLPIRTMTVAMCAFDLSHSVSIPATVAVQHLSYPCGRQFSAAGRLVARVAIKYTLIMVVCGFNILHYGSVSVRLLEKPRFRFGFQLSALATQRTINGFLCFKALQRWQSVCVTLLMLIRSLNYTFNRDTRHSHDDKINCNCVWHVLHKHCDAIQLVRRRPFRVHCTHCQTDQKNTFIRATTSPFQMLWFYFKSLSVPVC